MHNCYIFSDIPISKNWIIYFVCSSPYLSLTSSLSVPYRQPFPPSELRDRPVGYFDGTANGGACGVGMVLSVDSSQSFRIMMGVGDG